MMRVRQKYSSGKQSLSSSLWLLGWYSPTVRLLFLSPASVSDITAVIILQMFIAVINENFEVAEEQKKGKQALNYLTQQKAKHGTVSWMRRFNPYRWVKANPETAKVSNLPSNLVLPMQKSLVQDPSVSRTESRTVPLPVRWLLLPARCPRNHYFSSRKNHFASSVSWSQSTIHQNPWLHCSNFLGARAGRRIFNCQRFDMEERKPVLIPLMRRWSGTCKHRI